MEYYFITGHTYSNDSVYNSCQDVYASGLVEDGYYTIDPDGAGGTEPFQVIIIYTLSHDYLLIN